MYWLFCQTPYTCDCIEAVLCAGEPAGAPDIWMKKANVPAGTTYFLYAGWCYHINSEDPHGRAPTGALMLSSVSALTKTNCATCQSDPDHGNRHSPGTIKKWGGPGDGIPPSDDRGGAWRDGSNGTDPDSLGVVPTTPCPVQNGAMTDLYATVHLGDAAGTFIFKYIDNHCYTVDTTVTPITLPTGKTTVNFSGSFVSCDNCLKGIPCTACAGETPGVPAPWIRFSDIPGADMIFLYEGICWTFNHAATPTIISANVDTVKPTADYADCAACQGGVLWTPCDGDTSAPQVWTRKDKLPAVTNYDKWFGHCYTLDPAGAQVPKPANAREVVPRTECTHGGFDTCYDCICGIPCIQYGVKSIRCDNGDGGDDLYVPIEHLPAASVIDSYQGVCYSTDPWADQVILPQGALTWVPKARYASCYECTNAHWTGSITVNPPGKPPFPPRPPVNPKPYEPPPTVHSVRVRRCSDMSTADNIYISNMEGLQTVCIAGVCYEVEQPLVRSANLPIFVPLANRFPGCTTCNASCAPPDPCTDCGVAFNPQNDAGVSGSSNSELNGLYTYLGIAFDGAGNCCWNWEKLVGGTHYRLRLYGSPAYYMTLTEAWNSIANYDSEPYPYNAGALVAEFCAAHHIVMPGMGIPEAYWHFGTVTVTI